MNYNEFASLVPSETLEFVNNAMALVSSKYVSENAIRDNFVSYIILLNADKVSKSAIKNANSKLQSNYEEIFEYVKKYLLLYTDKSKYLSLYPYDLLINIKNVNYSGYYNILNDEAIDSDRLLRVTKSRDLEILRKNNSELDSKIVSMLPPDVYVLFKMASRIRNYLLRSDSNFKYGNVGIEAYSLILALYYFDNPEAKNLVDYFKSKGLSFSCFDKSTNLNMSGSTISGLSDDINIVKMYYLDYVKDLGDDYSLTDVVSRAFDNTFTCSGVVDSFLSTYGLISSDFTDLENALESTKVERREAEYRKQTNEFYSKFDRKTIDFIKLVFRIYTLIMEKLSKGECNTDIIKCSDDVDTLSILIASYYYEGTVSNYFIDHGIKLENIFEFLKLNIDKSSIDKTEIDELKLIDIFRRFVNDGVNKNVSKIDYNAIIANLCNRDFNKSFILEEIYGKYNNESLASDFSANLKKHFIEKEKDRINNVRNALFKDLSYDVIQTLEEASIYYRALIYVANNSNSSILSNMKGEDFVSLSILFASGYSNKSEISEYLSSINLDHNKLMNIFNNYSFRNMDSDIDIINEKFNHIIFGGVNSSRKREEITVSSLLANAFDEKVYSSIELRDFLHKYDVGYDIFSNFEKKFDDYKKDKLDKKDKDDYVDKLYDKFKDSSSVYLIGYAISIYERLSTIKNIDNEDRKYFALLIALMRVDDVTSKYFDKNNITEEMLLSSLNTVSDVLYGVNRNVDYRRFELYFKDYFSDLNKGKSISISDIRNFLINKDNKKFASVCSSKYNKLVTEVSRNTDYEDTLSISDKALLLKDEAVEDIDIDSMTSLVSYGNNLVNYSKDLQAIPVISSENPLLEITKIIERVKPKKVKKYTGFFMTKEIIETVPGEDVTPEIINDLTSKINDALESLRSDIVNYSGIIEYIKVYIFKINEYIAKVDSAITEAKRRYDSASDELDKYQYKLVLDNLVSMRTNLKNSVVVWKQEQLKYLQLSSNHFMNINSLTLTRDSLLPLISSESLLNKGLISENDSIKLQNSIFGILDSLVSKNANQAQDNLEQMRQLSLPEDLMSSIESTIDSQIKDADTPKLELK